MLKSLALRVLLGLALGLVAGAVCRAVGNEGLTAFAGTVEAVGGLWLNLLRMTIVPLVFCLLVTGVVSTADAAATGKLATRAIVLFAVATLGAAIYGTLAIQGVLALWPVDAASGAALRAGAGGVDVAALPSPGLGDWLTQLAPTNPIQAAAESAMLPLVVFAMFFGLAATRLAPARKAAVVELFSAIADAMITIVRWVLWAAPLGVFALSLGVGLRAGIGAAGSIAHYVIVVSLCTASTVLFPYIALAFRRGVGVGEFARATAPVQALAISTQSSLACLPAMVERAQDDLKIPPAVTGLVLPLAVAVFRITSPVANLGVAYFCAHVFGVHPSIMEMTAAVFVAWAVAVSSVGLPGQVSFMASIVPICLTLGVPVGLLPIFLAVEIIPDIFRTVGNVTADLGSVALLDPAEEAAEPRPVA